jgi:subtilase family serine protease
VKIPDSTPLGTYYVLACADDLKKITEANEGNNCRASTSRVALARADLITFAISNPPGQTAPGRTFSVSDTVRNHGQASAAASSTRYYLSLNVLRDAGDILLAGARAVPLLVAGATSTGVRTVTVPSTTPAGAYRVLACADDTAKVSEALETNNCAASTGTVQVLYPDLRQISVNNPPATASIGASVTVTDTVANLGSIATLTTKTRYYLSLDTIKNAADVVIVSTRSVPSVAAGGLNMGSRAVTIPTIAGATYYLFACADDIKLAVESNEGNNCRHAPAPITIRP